jgi:PKD repeat protein
MKTMNIFIFALVLLSLVQTSYALVWAEPYWLPVGADDPKTINFGETAIAATAGFSSIDRTIDYRAELWTSSGYFIKVLESHSVDVSRYTGFETVTLNSAAYEEPGTYYVRFYLGDSHDEDEKRLRLIVNERSAPADSTPVADLSATPTSGSEALTVSFTCTSAAGNSPLTYEINFGDGSSVVRSSSASHTYVRDGTYRAVCTVHDADGDSDSDEVVITVADNNPRVSLSLSPVSGAESLQVDFDCGVTGGNAPFTYNVSFGTGYSTLRSTGTYTFANAGNYAVRCTVTDRDGDINSITRTVRVTSNVPDVTFTAEPSAGTAPLTASFECSAENGNANFNYLINFGDGSSPVARYTSSRSVVLTHTYAAAGTYSASCRVTDRQGDFSSSSVSVVVSDEEIVPPVDTVPDVYFYAEPSYGDAPLETSLICEAEGDAPFNYRINFGDGQSITGTFRLNVAATHVYSRAGNYHAVCNVTDADGDVALATTLVRALAPFVPPPQENICPVFDELADRDVHVGEHLTFTLSAVDDASESLTYSADAPFNVYLSPTGVFSWTPSALQTGAHVVNFHVSDGACSDDVALNINVLPVSPSENRRPVADFVWSPAEPEVGERITFTSTSTDADGDALSCEWDFDADGWTDSGLCSAEWTFTSPGGHAVTLTVSDSELEDDAVKRVVVTGQLDVSEISCFDPVIEHEIQSCVVDVESNDVSVGEAGVMLYYEDGSGIASCITDRLTGSCAVNFDAGDTGVYSVYATAEKTGWESDLDSVPSVSFNVFAENYTITDLAVYSDPEFTTESYDFFRGAPMYVKFRVFDLLGNPADDVVTSVALRSPPGGTAWFNEFDVSRPEENYYYYALNIPTTHEFFGDSQIFTFAFNFDDGSGAPMTVEILIRNNPPVIDEPALRRAFDRVFAEPAELSLTQFEHDVEDSGSDLTWRVVGVNDFLADVSVSPADLLTITPLSEGSDIFTLILSDLDGGTDSVELTLVTESSEPVELPECSDGIDNDGDDLVDMEDPDCGDADDDSEAYAPQCNDGIDNDSDGLVDHEEDPGCSDEYDNDEFDITGNQPPVAVLTAPRYAGAPGMVLEIDGSESYDPDGEIVRYSWDVEGSDGYIYSEQDVEGQPGALTMRFDAVGTYEINLHVVDDQGAENAAAVIITISSGLPQCDDGVDNDDDGFIDYPADPNCYNEEDPFEADVVVPKAPEVFRDMDDLLVTRINLGDQDVESAVVSPGDYMRLSFSIENNLDYELEDIKIDASIYDLDTRDSNMFRDLDPGDSATVAVNLEIPYYAEPGLYDLRIVVSNNDVRRVKYRTITVV